MAEIAETLQPPATAERAAHARNSPNVDPPPALFDAPPPLKPASQPVDPQGMPPTRQCRTCAEEIQAAARICPRCRLPQPRRVSISPARLFCSSSALSLVVLAMVAFLSGRPALLSGEDFEEHAKEIFVAESTFDVSNDPGEASIATIGTLKNTGSIDWEGLLFEVRYFDAEGHLIDTESSKPPALVLRAGGETAFRVEGTAARPASQYVSHQVVVRDAEDRASWP